MADKEPTSRIEEYLESIINLMAEGKPVVSARLAERLTLTPATVSVTLHRMVRDGLIVLNKDKEIELTDKGRKAALSVLRRHRLAEKLLSDVLGVDFHEVHDEACLLEHAISSKVEERLKKLLNNPATCPHGNPIPNGDILPQPKGVPLSSVGAGGTVVLERITEEASRNAKLMEYFHKAGLMPGAVFSVHAVDPYAGTITLSRDDKQVTLAINASEMVWVTPKAKSPKLKQRSA
ncbi:MAG: metal-dependent transcriptional regulator [Chloroflexi bacterium]|nr:metal-dependent transcriptional regulator [Chloroflexota bacterium]